ncbi:MAG: hypothetical protein RBU21_04555 [FCB group bacterium]|jgi:hypothetical protein|nr:hypothetical protein [FCB group bacterium]
MNEQNRVLSIAEACKPVVNAYLMAKAYAQVKREQVDAVSRRLLAANDYMVADENRTKDEPPERITEPRYDWLMGSEAFAGYHAKRNTILLETGIKPADMPAEHCPALVAENLLVKAEWAMLETAWALVVHEGPVDGWKDLYGEMRKTFIDLVVKMVVNRPGYKNPLTGKAV